MPFKSKAQQRFMFSQHPRMAHRWAEETPDMKKLPERKKTKESQVRINAFFDEMEKIALGMGMPMASMGAVAKPIAAPKPAAGGMMGGVKNFLSGVGKNLMSSDIGGVGMKGGTPITSGVGG